MVVDKLIAVPVKVVVAKVIMVKAVGVALAVQVQ